MQKKSVIITTIIAIAAICISYFCYQCMTSFYDEKGFNKQGIHRNTDTKYNLKGFDILEIHRDTGTRYDNKGYDFDGYDARGYDLKGFDKWGSLKSTHARNTIHAAALSVSIAILALSFATFLAGEMGWIEFLGHKQPTTEV